ncbi:MAG: hypothetical protein J6J83_07785 [Oscillospiraceae bacterium]|nr:hypothetical protein [Oscillospiraceae bacterium]
MEILAFIIAIGVVILGIYSIFNTAENAGILGTIVIAIVVLLIVAFL